MGKATRKKDASVGTRATSEHVSSRAAAAFHREIQLWHDGYSMRYIANHVGRSFDSIANMVRNHRDLFPIRGKGSRGRGEPAPEPAAIYHREIQLWNEGYTAGFIAQKVGRSCTSIENLIASHRDLFPHRRSKGFSTPPVEPSVEFAKEIQLWNDGHSGPDIAKAVGKTLATVWGIIQTHRDLFPRRGKAWGRRRGPPIDPAIRYAREIQLWNEGHTPKEIARMVGRTKQAVQATIYGRSTRHLFPERKIDPAVAYRNVIALWEKGRPVCGPTGIAKAIGRSPNFVRGLIKRFPELFPARKTTAWAPDPRIKYQVEIELWRQGKTIPDIARAVHSKISTISGLVRRHRKLFPIRSNGDYHPGNPDRLPPKRAEAIGARRRKTLGKTSDPTFSWATKLFGQEIEDWRSLCERYLKHIDEQNAGNYAGKLYALARFLENYTGYYQLFNPMRILRSEEGRAIPPLIEGPENDEEGGMAFANNTAGIAAYNHVVRFLDWVLTSDTRFIEIDEFGRRITRRDCSNPFLLLSTAGMLQARESVWTPLPYKVIIELKNILAPGNHFSDWKWAQDATGGKTGLHAGDWYEVTDPGIIAKLGQKPGDPGYDPDLVIRERFIPAWRICKSGSRVRLEADRRVVEIWSPVRTLALLVKQEMPLRTFQDRVLDSGEADEERCDLIECIKADGTLDFHFSWGPNPRRASLLENLSVSDRKRVNRSQGVFRKIRQTFTGETMTGFFINTNKTGDRDKDWSNRGYVVEWEHRTLLRWLIKLRNWQEKYNPIDRPVLWSELDRTHLGAPRGATALRMMPPTCFLFRDASEKKTAFWRNERANRARQAGLRSKPIAACKLDVLWDKLVYHYETCLKLSGIRDENGEPIRLVKKVYNTGRICTYYPLHSLRVSLLSGLAFSGNVRIKILQKLAGHKHPLMTIFYTKMGPIRMHEELQAGLKRMADRADGEYLLWIKQLRYDALAEKVVTFSADSLRQVLPEDPTDRNALNWLRIHGGWCMVAGNTSPRADYNKRINGCHNGGPVLRDHPTNPSGRVYGGVRPRSCVAGGCRWCLTAPEYLFELGVLLNIKCYHLDDKERRLVQSQEAATKLSAAKLEAERNRVIFSELKEYHEVHTQLEQAEVEYALLKQEIDNLLAAIERCLDILAKRKEAGKQSLVALGTIDDVKVAFAETSSVMMQLSGICLDAVLYPALKSELGKAVMHRTQLLDQMAQRTFGQPIFFTLDEEAQLLVGNAVTRAMMRTLQARSEYSKDALHPLSALALIAKITESTQPLPADLKESVVNTLADTPQSLLSVPILSLVSKTNETPPASSQVVLAGCIPMLSAQRHA